MSVSRLDAEKIDFVQEKKHLFGHTRRYAKRMVHWALNNQVTDKGIISI